MEIVREAKTPRAGRKFATAAAWLALFALFACAIPSRAQSQRVAATPPMGWNSWNHFAEKVDDATIRAQADAMISTGMRDAGYKGSYGHEQQDAETYASWGIDYLKYDLCSLHDRMEQAGLPEAAPRRKRSHADDPSDACTAHEP